MSTPMQKKTTWHYSEFPEDPEVTKLMPGFEIQYMITRESAPEDHQTVFGHCVFPARSAHYKHKHEKAEEVVYVIKGKVVNGCTNDKGEDVDTVCGPGTATFVKKNQPHWTKNPFDEPAEFVFAYYGVPHIDDSGYVDLRTDEEKRAAGQ
jgi:oxalate decarboxylase/phosphoglucose isomerase-like protein (cupin superfamily)